MKERFSFKWFMTGVLAAIIPTVAAAWTFATVAANHVMQPHIEGAKARVKIMCKLAEVQNAKLKAICERVDAPCDTDLDQDLVAVCNDADK